MSINSKRWPQPEPSAASANDEPIVVRGRLDAPYVVLIGKVRSLSASPSCIFAGVVQFDTGDGDCKASCSGEEVRSKYFPRGYIY